MGRREVMRHSIRSLLALGCAAAFAGGVHAQQPVTLKMQATWPASLTLYDNFTFFADRVSKISGGTLQIDAMPAGQVVPAFEVLDATHKKVLDGAHSWSGYWVGKNKTAILMTGGPGGTFGMDMIDALGWMQNGGGLELAQEFFKRAQAEYPVVPDPALRAAGVRLVQAADQEPRRLQGHEMPPDRHGRRGVPAH